MESSIPSTSRLAPLDLSRINTTTFYPPTQVTRDLKAASNSATASEETFKAASESSTEWLLSLVPRPSGTSTSTLDHGEGKGKGREGEELEPVVHWYCGKEGGEECWDSAVVSIRTLACGREGDAGKWRILFER